MGFTIHGQGKGKGGRAKQGMVSPGPGQAPIAAHPVHGRGAGSRHTVHHRKKKH